MNILATILSIIAIIVIVFAILSVRQLTKRVDRLSNSYRRFMRNADGDDISATLNACIKQIDYLTEENKEIELELSKCMDRISPCMQKVGLVRFNAFENVGSNQSYAMAVLDQNDNGFLLSGIYARESSTTYMKPIVNGRCKYPVSAEEEKAINKAILTYNKRNRVNDDLHEERIYEGEGGFVNAKQHESRFEGAKGIIGSEANFEQETEEEVPEFARHLGFDEIAEDEVDKNSGNGFDEESYVANPSPAEPKAGADVAKAVVAGAADKLGGWFKKGKEKLSDLAENKFKKGKKSITDDEPVRTGFETNFADILDEDKDEEQALEVSETAVDGAGAVGAAGETGAIGGFDAAGAADVANMDQEDVPAFLRNPGLAESIGTAGYTPRFIRDNKGEDKQFTEQGTDSVAEEDAKLKTESMMEVAETTLSEEAVSETVVANTAAAAEYAVEPAAEYADEPAAEYAAEPAVELAAEPAVETEAASQAETQSDNDSGSATRELRSLRRGRGDRGDRETKGEKKGSLFNRFSEFTDKLKTDEEYLKFNEDDDDDIDF